MALSLPETDRLYFRQHELKDLDAFCRMEADPDFRRYVGGRPRPREEAEKRFMNGLQPASGNLGMWATVYKPEERYIGRCGVYQHRNAEGMPVAGEGALGLYIDPSYWGMGLATEAGTAFVAFGFKQIKLQKIVTAIDTRNIVSVRVIEKLGFKLDWTEAGEYRSFYHYLVTRDNYKISKL